MLGRCLFPQKVNNLIQGETTIIKSKKEGGREGGKEGTGGGGERGNRGRRERRRRTRKRRRRRRRGRVRSDDKSLLKLLSDRKEKSMVNSEPVGHRSQGH